MTKSQKASVKRLKDRYFRMVIAHPKGAVVHYGDCWWYCIQVCNCGLHADLEWMDDEVAKKLYPSYMEEFEIANRRKEQISHFPVPKVIPLTKAQQRKVDEMMEKTFPGYKAKKK